VRSAYNDVQVMNSSKFAVLCLTGVLVAQEPAPPPIRVTVTLVQIDAVVTDRQGKHVANLTADDFEVLENNKPRKISAFSYVSGNGEEDKAAATARRQPGQTLREQDVRRTIAFAVDDLRMTAVSLQDTRLALRKFVNTQMRDGDVVAIVATSGNLGSLQRFTSEKRLLLTAIDRIQTNIANDTVNVGDTLVPDDSTVANLLNRRFSYGTMGAIRILIEGMRQLPGGRKAVVLFSDGLQLRDVPGKKAVLNVDDARKVTDAANRSAVVIYSIDARGLVNTALNATDDVTFMPQESVTQALTDRMARFRQVRDGLSFLSGETGGLTMFDQNDLSLGVAKALEDQSGYYLLGFPRDADAKPTDPMRRLTVRLKNNKSGLKIRYRHSFSGSGPAAEEPKAVTPAARLLQALHSPFAAQDIELQLTPSFVLDDMDRPAIRGLVHLSGRNLEFGEPDAEGYRMATLYIVAMTEAEQAASIDRSFKIRVLADAVAKVRENGFVYTFEQALKSGGPHYLRVAVLDGGSMGVGSASRYVDVPDWPAPPSTVFCSGMSMAKGDPRQAGSADEASAALRQFRRGEPFSYGLTVYHSRPGLTGEARLLRDGKPVWTGSPYALAAGPRVPFGGVLTLGASTSEGLHTLEVRILEGGKPIASQSIEFLLR